MGRGSQTVKVFLTGAAGFIGFHTAKALLDQGHQVVGYDSVNSYYDPFYKELRLEVLAKYPRFQFHRNLLEEEEALTQAYEAFAPTHVIHLAAQAGVRYSLENPKAYVSSNLVGFQNILELVRKHRPQNFVYASSSSVYGSNKKRPFSEQDETSSPISLYAATKLSNELVVKSYGHLYQLPNTGLRFFTVYGPYGRPDMALFQFADGIRAGKKIPVFNQGQMNRDFTYIDDIVQGILAATGKPEINQIYNLARGKTERLLHMIELLENALGKKSEKEFLPLQPGDVVETFADISKAQAGLGYHPTTSIDQGIPHFVNWYRSLPTRTGV